MFPDLMMTDCSSDVTRQHLQVKIMHFLLAREFVRVSKITARCCHLAKTIVCIPTARCCHLAKTIVCIPVHDPLYTARP